MEDINKISYKGIPDSYTHLLRNYVAIFKCAALTYEIISSWICKKTPGQTFLEYIENENILGKHNLFKNEISQRKWLQKNERKLNQKDYSKFDVTFFHELLPILSDGKIARPGTVLHSEKLENCESLELLLHNLKEFRNNIIHEIEEASDESNQQKLKDYIHKCLETAGKKFKVSSENITVGIEKMQKRFNCILAETYTYQERIDIVIEILINNCFTEMQRRNYIALSDYNFSKINSNSSYYDIELSTENQSEENNKDVFLSSKFLSKISEKFVVIKGPSGSGKSTLMRALYHSILNKTEDENGPVFEGVDRFKFPLFIECRCAKSTNLVDYLKEEFPDDLSVIPKDEIIDAIRNIKGLVFLIDGIDEADVKSKELIDDVMSISKNLRNVSCIVTGRVEAANEFIMNDLSSKLLYYDEVSIEPIESLDQKLKFLKICDVNNLYNNKLNLQPIFKEMKSSIQCVFTSPMLLVIFYKIHLENSDTSSMKNERCLYEAIYLDYLDKITRKLKDSGIPNLKSTSNDLINVVCEFSFNLLSRNQYYMDEKDYLKMVTNCKVKTNKDVDIENILTCILSPANSSESKNMNHYFEHTSIQEYLAIKSLYQRITNTFMHQEVEENKENLELFLGCLYLEADDPLLSPKINRYKLIIRLLIFEILADDNMPKFKSIIGRIFHEYIGPDQQFYMELIRATNCDKDAIQIITIIAPLLKSIRITKFGDFPLIMRIVPHAIALKKLILSLNKHDERIYTIFMSNSIDISPVTLSLELKFSYYAFKPMKPKFYSDLNQIRYQIDHFKACVTKTHHLRIVVGKMKSGGQIVISTTTLKSLHFSMPLHPSIMFSLMIKYTERVEDYPRNPVPGNTFLCIRDVSEYSSLENLLEIIKNIAPNTKTFSRISLIRCKLSTSNVQKLLKNLINEGIRTKPEMNKNKKKQKSRVISDNSSGHQLILMSPNRTEHVRRQRKIRPCRGH